LFEQFLGVVRLNKRCEIFTPVKVYTVVFWVVTLCMLVGTNVVEEITILIFGVDLKMEAAFL
jgi:hypothetical protein